MCVQPEESKQQLLFVGQHAADNISQTGNNELDVIPGKKEVCLGSDPRHQD